MSANALKILIGADISPLIKKMAAAERSIKGFGKNIENVGDNLLRMAAPFAAASALGLSLAVGFDDSIRKVGATSNATAQEMVQLKDAALKAGETTKFTAREGAEALNYMAQAGWNTKQSIAALPGVLNLAAASGEALGMTADILADSMTGFKMQASESSKAADILAQAAASSNTNVAMLGDSFRYVAPLAGTLGYTMEDTAVALGLMANSGIKASQAGTAMRATLSRLVKPTADSSQAMEMLGLKITDSAGKMKPLRTVLEELRGKMKGIHPEQQAMIAGMLGGQEAISGLLAVVSASDDDFNNMTDAINHADGAAKRMAETMEGGLGGSMRELQSMTEGLLIEFGDMLIPTIKEAVEVGKTMVKWLKDMDPEIKQNIVSFGKWTLGLGVGFKATGMLIEGIGGLVGGFKNLVSAISKVTGAMIANPWTAGIIVLTAAAAAIYALTQNYDTASASARALNEVNAEATKSIAREKTAVELLIKQLEKENITKEERGKIIDKLKAINPTYFAQLDREKSLYNEVKASADSYIDTLVRQAKIKATVDKIADLSVKLEDVNTAAEEAKPSIGQMALNLLKFGNTSNLAASGIQTFTKNLLDSRAETETQIKTLHKYLEELEECNDEVVDFNKNTDNAGNGFRLPEPGKIAKVTSSFAQMMKVMTGFELDYDKLFSEKNMKAAMDKFSKGWDDSLEKIKNNPKVKSVMDPVIQGIMDSINAVQAFENSIEISATNKLEKFADDAGEAFKNIAKFLEKWVSPAIDAAMGAFDAYTDNRNARIDATYEKEKAAIEGSLMSEEQKAEAMKKIDLKRDKERRKILRQEAIANKALGIFNATISTAVGVAKAFELGPWGIALAAVVGALGAVQIGMIASAPLPALAKGGMTLGETVAIIGDNPSGKEAVIPFERMGEFLDMAGAGINNTVDVVVEVVGRLSGRDIYFANAREAIIQNRVTGR